MTTKHEGHLEIDHERGVMYFHENKTGHTLFRICRLPTPIPARALDVSHMHGADWNGQPRTYGPSNFEKQMAYASEAHEKVMESLRQAEKDGYGTLVHDSFMWNAPPPADYVHTDADEQANLEAMTDACPDCKGTGEYDNGPETANDCHRCNATGRIPKGGAA